MNNLQWKTIELVLQKHAPSILTGIGIGGFITSTITAIKATPNYISDHTEEKKKLSEEAKLIAKHYWPTIAIAGGSAACILLANRLNLQRQAALAAACSLSETALKNYQAKSIELFGEKQHEQVVHEVNKEDISSHKILEDPNEYLYLGKGDQKFIDSWTGVKFRSNAEHIRECINLFNADMLEMGYACYNELYDILGLPNTDAGGVTGWSCNSKNDLIRAKFDAHMVGDEAIIYVSFQPEPNLDLRRY